MSLKRREARRRERLAKEAAHVPDQAVIDVLPLCANFDFSAKRAVCLSLGNAHFAVALARQLPNIEVTCHYLDAYRAELARRANTDAPQNLSIICESELPAEEVDLAVLPFQSGGEAELSREMMQTAHLRLRIGGRMVVSTERKQDVWLHQQMQSLFSKVTHWDTGAGTVYAAIKTAPLKKIKNFECEFAFRDQGRLIHSISRPGVFSHRRLDLGARALIDSLQVKDGDHVWDMGCGSGTVGFAAALRAANVHVHATDSNPRAVECSLRGAEENQLESYSAQLDVTGTVEQTGLYDLFVGLPPHYTNYRVAKIFVRGAAAALKPGGRVQFVVNQPDWYLEFLVRNFDDLNVVPSRKHLVISGVRRDS